MRATVRTFPKTDAGWEETGELSVLQIFIRDVKAQPRPDPAIERQAAQDIAQGVAGLRDLLLRLPLTWARILDALKRKRLKTLFEDPSCPSLPPLEPIRFLLHSLTTDWPHALDAQTRELLGTRAVAALSPLPFTHRFLLKVAEAVEQAPLQTWGGLSAAERCAILAAMQPHLHHIHSGINSLVESHMQLATTNAERYRRFGLQDTEILDLVQESSLGLMRAARHYDPHRGRFQTYALFWLQQAIGRYLLKRGHLVSPPSQMLQASRKVTRKAQDLEAWLERAPTVEELAEATGLSVTAVVEAQEASCWCVSLETPIGEEDLTLGDLLVDDRIGDFEEDE